MGIPQLERDVESWLISHDVASEFGKAGTFDRCGNPYTTLCIGGTPLKESEVQDLFFTSLEKWLDGRKYIIWRIVPSYREEAGEQPWLYLRCRLTAYPEKP